MRREASPDDAGRLARTLAAVQALVQDPLAPAALAADRRAWLVARGLAPEDVDALAEADPRRLLIYRRLVRGGLAAAARAELPRTAARLGARFDATVAAFCDDELPRSPLLRDVAIELFAYARPRWLADPEVPAWIVDLAAHELVELEVGWHDSPAVAPDPRAADALSLGRAVRLAPSARLARYGHAIHRLAADPDEGDAPPRAPTALLVYRDEALTVRFLELSPLAAGVAERLIAGTTLGAAVLAACEAAGTPPGPEVLGATAALLADLAARGVVLGPA